MSWEHLQGKVGVCDPEDGYDLLRYCDVVIARQSTMFLEASLFRRPMLFVDYPELWLPPHLDDNRLKKWYPPPRFTPPSRRDCHPMGGMGDRYGEIPDPEMRAVFEEGYQSVLKAAHSWGHPADYIGSEVAIEELAEVLDGEAYLFDEPDVYDGHVREHCLANDGRSYERVADVVESVAQDGELWQKIRQSQRFRPVVRSAFEVSRHFMRARRAAGRLKERFS